MAAKLDADVEQEWEIWAHDRFDRECPPQKELTGRGLVSGLRELWRRHLIETVQPDGQTGFIHFNLRCASRYVAISGPESQWVSLKSWTNNNADSDGEMGEQLLEALAAAHARLILSDLPVSFLANAVSSATDGESCIAGLAGISEGPSITIQ
ncbi:MAG: hypothetical protein O3A00_03545 [Planctomycetota bacterium]|nr:hypothetical protein [Planctomycetota bacterium]